MQRKRKKDPLGWSRDLKGLFRRRFVRSLEYYSSTAPRAVFTAEEHKDKERDATWETETESDPTRGKQRGEQERAWEMQLINRRIIVRY
jgi:hypothetical protein